MGPARRPAHAQRQPQARLLFLQEGRGPHPLSARAPLTRLRRGTEEENRRAILVGLPVRRGASLLDLGTGDGAFTERVARRVGANRVVGVELGAEAARAARSRGIEVHEGDLEQRLPFEDDEFEIVHANQVIEHLRGTDLFLAEIRRVLAPGGVACISTNNLASWHNIASLVLGLQPMPAHVSDDVIVGNRLNPEHGDRHEEGRSHLRLFTASALRDLCRHHGLEPLEVRTVGMYPLPPRAARMAVRVDPTHGAFLIGLFAPSSAA